MARSLPACVSLSILVVISRANGGRNVVLERQNEGSLALVHLGLESALVESLAHGAHAAARSPPCDDSGSALFIVPGQLLVLRVV